MGSYQAHQDLLYYITDRLINGRPYRRLETEIQYDSNGIIGEVDILLFRDGIYYLYEIKSGTGKFAKATEQYIKYCNAYPFKDVRGIYVGADGVKRMPRHIGLVCSQS